jgi:hypothetical protein
MICICTHCGEVLTQDREPEGLNYCTNCRNIFFVPLKPRVPSWIWGVVAVLMANWQLLRGV